VKALDFLVVMAAIIAGLIHVLRGVLLPDPLEVQIGLLWLFAAFVYGRAES